MKNVNAKSSNTRIKYNRTKEQQIELGVKVTVAAYNKSKKTKHLCDAVMGALKQFDVREVAILPRPDAIQGHVSALIKAIESKKRPEGERGWQIVIQKAYDEITGGQIPMPMPETDDCDKPEDVSVNGLCDQENVAGQCDEKANDEPSEKEKKANASRKAQILEEIHDLQVAHCALVMSRVATESKSFHIEDGIVTISLPYMTWYNLCMRYDPEMEVF